MTTKGYLSQKQLKQYREVLLATRTKITLDVEHIESQNLNNSHKDSSGDLSGYALHMADVGTDNYDRELALDVVGNEQDILYQIDRALKRMDSGQFGICEMTGQQIPVQRLDAIPWTPYCKEAAERVERERGRG